MKSLTRRKFVAAALATVGAASVIKTNSNAEFSAPKQTLTISDVIAVIKQSISFDASAGTVDTIKSGDASQPVTGIISTMFPTVDIIRKAISLKANFIIVHEPSFYNHLDETDWLKEHDVYSRKSELLQKHNIVVWRFHDYWHANQPDGIMMGVLTKLGWEKYYNTRQPRILDITPTKLSEIIGLSKNKLGIQTLRYIGNKDQLCSKIALLPGAWGGKNHIKTLHEFKPDLLICGELQEWETSEYIRDARSLGINTSLIVLGHSVSEEPGMEWLVQWLQPKIPNITITHIASGNPFSFA